MIDIKALRANPQPYIESAQRRGLKVDFERLAELDQQRAQLVAAVDGLRAELKVGAKPSDSELNQLQQRKAELTGQEQQLQQLEQELEQLIVAVPNLLAPDTPEGGEEANRVERTWGKPTQFEFEPFDHQALAEQQGWLDFERGAKVAGSKFYFYRGAAVKLELAVKRLALDLAEQAGFLAMDVPHLVNTRIATGSGFNPRAAEQQIYSIEGEDLHLIATAELPLTGYHADEILDPASLPLLYTGWSPSYRREAGAYGKPGKGLFRVHQFNKLELYVFCAASESEQWLQRLVELEEQICQQLEIPYRVTRTAVGDLGAPHYQKYDVEYWSPVEQQYRELMSAANCTDYQARRLNIRTRDEAGQPTFVHTLNATAAAISRIFIALWENHQQADASVKLPAALVPYYGGSQL